MQQGIDSTRLYSPRELKRRAGAWRAVDRAIESGALPLVRGMSGRGALILGEDWIDYVRRQRTPAPPTEERVG